MPATACNRILHSPRKVSSVAPAVASRKIPESCTEMPNQCFCPQKLRGRTPWLDSAHAQQARNSKNCAQSCHKRASSAPPDAPAPKCHELQRRATRCNPNRCFATPKNRGGFVRHTPCALEIQKFVHNPAQACLRRAAWPAASECNGCNPSSEKWAMLHRPSPPGNFRKSCTIMPNPTGWRNPIDSVQLQIL